MNDVGVTGACQRHASVQGRLQNNISDLVWNIYVANWKYFHFKNSLTTKKYNKS